MTTHGVELTALADRLVATRRYRGASQAVSDRLHQIEALEKEERSRAFQELVASVGLMFIEAGEYGEADRPERVKDIVAALDRQPAETPTSEVERLAALERFLAGMRAAGAAADRSRGRVTTDEMYQEWLDELDARRRAARGG
jgi:hypothetical protein